jgi:hypothetical protein
MLVKIHYLPLLLLLMAFIVCTHLHASGINYLTEPVSADTVTNKDLKKTEKEAKKIELRNSNNRFEIKTGYVYAFLNTNIAFEFNDKNLITILSLEDDLELPSKDYFFTGAFRYRITPRSGIYAHYYGINRSKESQTNKEIIFRDDTFQINSDVKTYFNTQVVSAGYLLSVLEDPNTFLGFYFNVYLMFLKTGVTTDIGSIDADYKFALPMPNLGIVANFKLNKWIYLNGNVSFFSLNTKSFGGSIYSYNLEMMARPVHWLGISLSYQEFDVRAEFPDDRVTTVVDYNFRGPAAGLSFYF